MGRRGSIEWPARSPDLSPLDFFCWGYLKDKVYSRKLTTLQELKYTIQTEITQLKQQPELLRRVCHSVTTRGTECMEANGEQFECFR